MAKQGLFATYDALSFCEGLAQGGITLDFGPVQVTLPTETSPGRVKGLVNDDDPDIVVTGRVADIRPYLRASDCMLVALDYGGGTRLKILEAFAAGCPVVGTPKGAEGLPVTAGTHLIVGASDEELVERTAEMCTRPGIATALCANARGLVEQELDWPVVHAAIAAAVSRLVPGFAPSTVAAEA